MSDPPTPANDAEDPEIPALLEFEPVPRKRVVEGAWTPELQREFISRLAVTGSIGRAADEMGKTETGVRKLYRSPGGASFRASWDKAIALAKRRLAEREPLAETVSPGSRPPSLDNRRKHWPTPERRAENAGEPAQPDLDDDQKWELVAGIASKFMRKVAREREARLAGEVVAADFYLRQITVLEVMFDLTATRLGFDPHDVLRDLRRGRHGLVDIAATGLSDWLDASRRRWWAEEGEPERPSHPDVRFLKPQRSAEGGYATQEDMYAGPWSGPPPGVDEEQWKTLDRPEQERRIAAIRAQLEHEQADWERRAREAWEASRAQYSSDEEGRP
jgi:hypothetical protein